jgi:phospho-N-acetylmuramoyl-pentapeptide-transferase
MTKTLYIAVHTNTLVHIFLLGFLGFLLAMALTPVFTHYAYKYQWWKKQRTTAMGGASAAVYQQLHAAKHKRNVPNMAGLIFILAITLVTLFGNLNRGQTWLPLAGLLAAGLIGLVDDVMNIRGTSKVAGMTAKVKFGLYSAVLVSTLFICQGCTKCISVR